MESSDKADVQLRAMALLASLRTAVEVCEAISLRREGRDPSEQLDAATARRSIGGAAGTLREILVQLRLSLVTARPEEVGLIRAFEDHMLLARAARELHIVHQHLLSLYPEVDSALVEEARIVQAEAARLASSEEVDLEVPLVLWTDRLAGFVGELVRALPDGRTNA